MPNTVVGLFRNSEAADRVIGEIEALDFARNEVRRAEEPAAFEVTGVMSFPRLDFETGLERAFRKIGATDAEARNYVQGLRNGGTVVFATDDNEKLVRAAADVMNRHSAVKVEEGRGPAPHLPTIPHEGPPVHPQPTDLGGRVAQTPEAGRPGFFTW